MTCESTEEKLAEAKQLIADFANDAQAKGLIDMVAVPGFAVPTLIMGGGVPKITVTGSNTLTDTSNASTYTFSDVSGLNSHTHVFLTVTVRGNAGAVTVSSLTVEGNAATFVVGLTTGWQRSEIWKIANTATTPDIVVNLSGTADNIKVGVVGANGADLTNFATPTSSNADPATLSLNTANNGLVIACGLNGSSGSMTWTGVNEISDTNLETYFTHTWGYSTTTTAESPRTVSGDWSSSNYNTCVCASFGPAITYPARILDSYSNVTGAWSMSRAIVGSFGDAARYTTDVGVNQITDQTGNGRHLVQGTGSAQPSVRTDLGPQNRTGARFDGINDTLNGSSPTGVVSASSGYFAACGILRAIDTNDATIRLNDALFAATGFGVAFKNSSGTYSWSVYNNDGSVDSVGANFASSPIDQVIVVEYRHEGGTLYGRVTLQGGAPGAWQSVSSGDVSGLNFNVAYIAGVASSAYSQVDFLEAATFDAVPNETLRDALVNDMLAHYG